MENNIPNTSFLVLSLQLFVALDALKDIGILQTDIKPDNIMFVNVQSLRIKLINFGEAISAISAHPGMNLKLAGYRRLYPSQLIRCHCVSLFNIALLLTNCHFSLLRAPEIAFGLPFTQAIDVWGVGCTIAFIYLAENLFLVDCDHQMVGQLTWTNVHNQVEPFFIMSTVTVCFVCK